MGLFMFLNLGIKMPEIRLVIRCICAPLLHVNVCLHFGNNLSFYHVHFFIVFVFVQKSVKKNGVNVPYKLLSNFIFLFFSFFYQFWSLIPPKSYFICNSMRVNQITVFQIILENIVCLQNTCLVFVCILTSQLHVVSDKTAINFFLSYSMFTKTLIMVLRLDKTLNKRWF